MLGPGALWGAVLCIGGCSAVLASTYWMPVAAPHMVTSSTVSRHCRVSVWEGQNGFWWRTTALSSQCPCFSERESDLGTVAYCSGAKPDRGPGANSQPRALPPSWVLCLSDQFLSHGSADGGRRGIRGSKHIVSSVLEFLLFQLLIPIPFSG